MHALYTRPSLNHTLTPFLPPALLPTLSLYSSMCPIATSNSYCGAWQKLRVWEIEWEGESIGSNCPGISGTVLDFLPLSRVPEGLT